MLVFDTRSALRHVVALLRGKKRRFDLMEVVGWQTLMLVEILEALVFVLSALEIYPRLLQFLMPQPCFCFRVGGGSRVCLAGCSIETVPIIRGVQVR